MRAKRWCVGGIHPIGTPSEPPLARCLEDEMSQYYVPLDLEKNIGWHIPFTPYFFYRDPDFPRLWRIVEKELSIHKDERPYAYRFL